MPDLERVCRELQIELEPTEEGKEALRNHFKMVDKQRWLVAKIVAVVAVIFVIISWCIV